MSGDSPQAEERQIAANLHAIRERVDSSSFWRVRDVDMMADGSAYLFYIRSKGMHRFLNAMGDIVKQYPYDTTVMVPAELVGRSIDKTYDHILATAKEELKRDKSSA